MGDLSGKNSLSTKELSSDFVLKVGKNGEFIDFYGGEASELLSKELMETVQNIWQVNLFSNIRHEVEDLLKRTIDAKRINTAVFNYESNGKKLCLELYIIPHDNDKAMLFLKNVPGLNSMSTLAASEHMRLLAHNLPCGFLLIFNNELRFTFVEGEGFACMGLNKEDFEGKKIGELIDISIVPVQIYTDALAGKVTNTRMERNGKSFHITVFPLTLQGKTANNGMMIGFDITYLLAPEQQMKQAMKAIEEKNRQLEEFNFVASHDLQEPLRMVTSFTQLLAKKYSGRLDEEAEQFIEYALEGATRIKTIVRDLITYIRVDKNHVSHIRLEPLDAVELVRNDLMLDILERNAEIKIATELPDVYYDFGQLTEVFRQLLSNALKFNTSAPDIIISAEEHPDEVIFAIEDNGIGIAPEYHLSIFDLFQRLNGRDKYAGNGLGLAIVKNIVERQGGRLYCESLLGKGSKFFFTIPKKSNKQPVIPPV